MWEVIQTLRRPSTEVGTFTLRVASENKEEEEQQQEEEEEARSTNRQLIENNNNEQYVKCNEEEK